LPEKRPTIAEKVRFWEEQDKINQALIPRVIEIHEAVGRLHERTANISGEIAAAEGRVLEQARGLLDEQTVSVSGQIAAAEARVLKQVHKELEERIANIGGQIVAAEARVLKQVDNQVAGRLRLVTYGALVLSVVAFALTVYQFVR